MKKTVNLSFALQFTLRIGISNKGNHWADRDKCIAEFHRIYGEWPLKISAKTYSNVAPSTQPLKDYAPKCPQGGK